MLQLQEYYCKLQVYYFCYSYKSIIFCSSYKSIILGYSFNYIISVTELQEYNFILVTNIFFCITENYKCIVLCLLQ